MPVLRELISRFSFSTDKKSVANYERTISNMKRTAVRLGAVLGLAFSGKALFNMGMSATQAKQNIEDLAGTNLQFLNNEFELMKSRIDDVRAGASEIVTTKTKDILAAAFVKTFSNSKKELKDFISLFESASIKAITTGETIESVFGGLMSAIETGDLSSLAGFGKIGLTQRKIAQAKISAQDPGEFGGLARPAIARKTTLELLKSTLSTQQDRLRTADLALIKTEQFQKGISETLNELSAGLLQFAAGAGEAIQERAEKKRDEFFKDESKTDKSIKNQSVQMNNTFHITESNNAQKTGEMVRKEISNAISEADRQRIRGEDQ